MEARAAPRRYGPFRVLIAGGGVAALEALLALRALAGELVDIEILAPETRFYYQPLAVVEPFGGALVRAVEVARVARAAGARVTLGELASVDVASRVARTSRGMVVPYDALLVAVGATPRATVDGAVTFRGPADTERVAAIAQGAARRAIASIVLAIPTTVTWPLPLYELAFGLRTVSDARITIATREPAPLSVLGQAPSSLVSSLLVRERIDVEPFEPHLVDGRSTVIAAPELVAHRIHGLPGDDDGFLDTSRFGRVHDAPHVYAAGDVTTFPVKHGSIAAAQADAAAAAIAVAAGAEVPAEPFRPVVRAAVHCGRETVYARRDVGDPRDRGEVSREPLWAPPAKIAARYLAPALAELALADGRRGLAAVD
ncbi:MAG TPA: hypothetical protein VGC78_13810 [Gaiellaceae bacterium]|jgi:sulfide:quinone oxidoreductase